MRNVEEQGIVKRRSADILKLEQGGLIQFLHIGEGEDPETITFQKPKALRSDPFER